MPIITPDDLSSNIYADVLAEITRGNNDIVANAITAAEQEAKMYLTRYNFDALFGSDTTQPTVTDAYLKSLLRDIACWHILRLATASVDYAAFRSAYEDAITMLKAIRDGDAQPEGWPYADTVNETAPDGDTVSWSSNPRRNNYY